MLGLALGAEAVHARPFYNPTRFQRTRQSTTDRVITKRLGKKRAKTTAAPAPRKKLNTTKRPAPVKKPASG